MAKVRLLNGKPLLIGGKVATTDNCCCEQPPTGCELPEGDCPHAICVEFKLDSDDTSDNDIVTLRGAGVRIGFYYEPSDSTWNIYGFSMQVSIPATDIFDTWHRATLQFTSNGDGTLHVEWSVDGVDGEAINPIWACTTPAIELRAGAYSGSGDAHRTIRLVNLVANPALVYEHDFTFPDSAFDDLIGGAVIDGDGFLRIDMTDGDDAYGVHFMTFNMDCICCVPRDVTEISTLTVSVSVSGNASGCGCQFPFSGSVSAVYNRINLADPFTDPKQFQLYFTSREDDPTKCDLNININSMSGGDETDEIDIPVDSYSCGSCIRGCGEFPPGVEFDINGNIVSLGFVRGIVTIVNDGVTGGTLTLEVGAACNAVCLQCDSAATCEFHSAGVADNAVTFTYDDVPGVTSSLSQSDSLTGGCAADGAGTCTCFEDCTFPASGPECFPCVPPKQPCPSCSKSASISATAVFA